jgi:hypothetical protein
VACFFIADQNSDYDSAIYWFRGTMEQKEYNWICCVQCLFGWLSGLDYRLQMRLLLISGVHPAQDCQLPTPNLSKTEIRVKFRIWRSNNLPSLHTPRVHERVDCLNIFPSYLRSMPLTLDLLFRRSCYYQNASNRKMNAIKVLDKLSICKVGFVHFWHIIYPKKLQISQEMVLSFHEVQS